MQEGGDRDRGSTGSRDGFSRPGSAEEASSISADVASKERTAVLPAILCGRNSMRRVPAWTAQARKNQLKKFCRNHVQRKSLSEFFLAGEKTDRRITR